MKNTIKISNRSVQNYIDDDQLLFSSSFILSIIVYIFLRWIECNFFIITFNDNVTKKQAAFIRREEDLEVYFLPESSPRKRFLCICIPW